MRVRPCGVVAFRALVLILSMAASHPGPSLLLASDGDPPSLTSEQRSAAIAVARAHLDRGGPELALELLEPLMVRTESDPEVTLLYGEALFSTDRFNEAVVALEEACRAPASCADAELLRARAYVRLDDLPKAVRAVDRAWQAGYRDLELLERIPDLAPLLEDPHFLFLLERFEDSLTPFHDEIEVFHAFEGRAAHEHYGWATIEIGDLDGDGANDLAVSAPFARNEDSPLEVGRVELWSSRGGTRLHEFFGPVAEGRYGHSLGKMGDFNADGTPDLIIGAPGSAEVAGRVQVRSGSDGVVLLEAVSSQVGDEFGSEARGIGDWNGDGFPDFLVGAPGHDGPAGVDAGRVELRSGRDLSVLVALDGEREGDRVGSAAWGAARADGHFLVVGAGAAGAAGAGEARLYRGEEARLLEVVESDRTGAALGGSSVSLVGDVDADGVPDFSISDWQNHARGKWTGRVVVHSGANGARLRTLTGGARDGYGTGDLIAGDVDLDGHADLLVGSWLSSRGASGGGAVFLVSGATSEVLATWCGRTVGDHVGFDATGLGDVDGDGALDFAISAANSSVRGPDTGRVFIVSGPCLFRGEFPPNLSGETTVEPR